MEVIRNGFKELFTSSKTGVTWTPSLGLRWQVKISDSEKDSLYCPVTEDEIKSAIWSMKAFKAPGPDDLYAGFFQFSWPTVGASMV